MRGSRVKALRSADCQHPGRKHGGRVTDPPSMRVGVGASRYAGPVPKNDGHDAERIVNAERKRQRRNLRNRMNLLR